MCGITGIIKYNNNLMNEIEMIHNMTASLAHRGPDSYGYYYNENVLLGHRRLIILDKNGGHQPLSLKINFNEYTIVFDGEIYNAKDLRIDLIAKGYVFDSHSDVEVVLKSYIEWGIDCIQYFNGVFAFGIWDSKSKELFLARDRIGAKPLFYTQVEDYFIFASEIKALLKHPSVKPVFTENSLLELFSLGPSRINGSGLFKNIYELKPAEYIRFKDNRSYKKIYWKPITNEHNDSIDSTIEQISFLVEDSVRNQLVSDVPLCSFLSGGLDSSALSSIAGKYYKDKDNSRIDTYSIDYEDNDVYFSGDSFQPSNDNIWVNRVSKYINSNHTRVEIEIEDLAHSLMEAAYANDYPGMADIDSSLLLFCKEVKKQHTVALSGECADEIFGGYPWYRNFTDIHYNGFPWNKHIDVRQSFLSENLSKLDLDEFAHNEYQKSISEIEYLDSEGSYNKGIRRLTYLNYKWFMVTLLTRSDRMSMKSGLQIRVPFADYRIIEYTYNIPWVMKYKDNIEKGLLRTALKDYLPHEIINRKKSPFPKTYHPKYNTILCKLMKEILDKPSSPIGGLININKVNNLINNDLNLFQTPWFGQLMKGSQFIAYLIQLNYFLEKYNVSFEGI